MTERPSPNQCQRVKLQRRGPKASITRQQAAQQGHMYGEGGPSGSPSADSTQMHSTRFRSAGAIPGDTLPGFRHAYLSGGLANPCGKEIIDRHKCGEPRGLQRLRRPLAAEVPSVSQPHRASRAHSRECEAPLRLQEHSVRTAAASQDAE